MDTSQIKENILTNLYQGLEKQSEAYLTLISSPDLTHEQRRDFDKELQDIKAVFDSLNSTSINYTVKELEALKLQFDLKLSQLTSIINSLEINTLKIEFDSLTPQQKEFLKGQNGTNGLKGETGLSAYEVALNGGFVGSIDAWLSSLKGKDGINGTNGKDGLNGSNGVNGINGLSAYEIAKNSGFSGTLEEWLLSLKGSDGINGTNGKDGVNGSNGVNGLSAYEIAKNSGFSGTLQEWLLSLKGQDGINGTNGKDGLNGSNGVNGINGLSAYEIAVLNGFVGSEIEFIDSLKLKLDGNTLAQISSVIFESIQFKQVLSRLTALENSTAPTVPVSYSFNNENLENSKNLNLKILNIPIDGDILKVQLSTASISFDYEFRFVKIDNYSPLQPQPIKMPPPSMEYFTMVHAKAGFDFFSIHAEFYKNTGMEQITIPFDLNISYLRNDVLIPFDVSKIIEITRDNTSLVTWYQ